VYEHQGEEALEIQLELVKRNPGSYVELYKLGRLYQAIGRPQQQWESALTSAKVILEDELRIHQQNAIAATYLGLIETRLGRFSEATNASLSAKAVAPEDAKVLFNIARMFALQDGKRKDALQYLSKAVDTWFDIEQLLNMDFYVLRSDPGFEKAITRR
jgi:tetratricopeptide (TPR) repeat protein